MAKSRGKHLCKEQREVIEDGIRAGDSARSIARRIGVSPSTVTREVKANRTVTEARRRPGARLSVRCARYRECCASGSACAGCSTALTICKHCRTRSCIDSCPDFELKMCPTAEAWPYVCPPDCRKRGSCSYPKCRYDAADANAAYRARLVAAREGVGITEEELAAMVAIVAPLVRQGQSYEAIWATYADELPVCARSAYSYQEKGLMGTPDLLLPRKARMRKRKRKGAGARRDRVDRTGRTYADFEALPLADRARVVQCDSVEGYERCAHDILSMHIVARSFQIYLRKPHASAKDTVACLDHMERLMGSAGAFEAVFGILLADRGVEFDDWEGLERSCLERGARRCRVFYCDAMKSNQKSACERNHEQLRRILPKGRSDFDALSPYDVAVCCSHVNSYPLAGRAGRCPFELLGDLLPGGVMDELGLARVAPDEVVLRPALMPHAVEQ